MTSLETADATAFKFPRRPDGRGPARRRCAIEQGEQRHEHATTMGPCNDVSRAWRAALRCGLSTCWIEDVMPESDSHIYTGPGVRLALVRATTWINRIGARTLGERALAAPPAQRTTPPGGAPCLVTEIKLSGIRPWGGPEVSRRESFGKRRGQVHFVRDTTPEPSCHEVELAEAMRAVRDDAYWFSPGGFGGDPAPLASVGTLDAREGGPGPGSCARLLADLNRSIRALIAAPHGGTPDVIAWDEVEPLSTAIFVECKGATEPFKQSQEDWG